MRGYGIVVAALAVVVGSGVTAGAQKENSRQGVCPVQVYHFGDDAVGSRFALALKERIKKSALFRLAESRKDASFGVDMVSVDLADPDVPKGSASAIAVTFLAVNASPPDYYLTTGVHVVGSSRVDASADATLADLDKSIDSFGLRSGCH